MNTVALGEIEVPMGKPGTDEVIDHRTLPCFDVSEFFAVHRTLFTGGWTATHKPTGFAACKGMNTPFVAIACAREMERVAVELGMDLTISEGARFRAQPQWQQYVDRTQKLREICPEASDDDLPLSFGGSSARHAAAIRSSKTARSACHRGLAIATQRIARIVGTPDGSATSLRKRPAEAAVSRFQPRGNSYFLVRSCAKTVMVPVGVARQRNKPERRAWYWRLSRGEDSK